MTPSNYESPREKVVAAGNLNRSLRPIYLFQALKSLQLFGAVAVPFYLEWAGVDYTRMFLLEGAFALFMVLLEVPTGTIADRFGRKVSLMAGAVLTGSSFVMFGVTRSYPLYFGANFLCAAGMTCISGADQALIYDTLLAAGKSGEGRRVLARYQAVGTAAMMVGFVVGAWLAGVWVRPQSLATVFVMSGAAFALAAVPLMFVAEPVRAEKLQHPLREGIEGMRMLLAPGELRRLAFNYATVSATGFFMFWFYQSLAREAALPIAANGLLGAGLNLLGMVLLWKAGALEARLGLGRLLMITAVAPGCFYLALAGFRPPVFALVAAFIVVGCKLLREPLLSDLINQRVESRRRATILSGVSLIERAVVFVLYPLVGLAADRSLSVAFAGLGVVSLIFALRLRGQGKASVNAGQDSAAGAA
jgi:MFS family permease